MLEKWPLAVTSLEVLGGFDPPYCFAPEVLLHFVRNLYNESMEAKLRQTELFTDGNGNQPFVEWLLGLKDKDGKAAIQDRLDRLERGNFGDCAHYGAVTKLRVHVGPGYRVYLD